MTAPLLSISDLKVSVAGKTVVDGLSLAVPPGEVHAIMGPNGSGKSTLAKALAGHPAYTIAGGTASIDGRDLLAMEPEARVHAGLFVGFQYPTEVPGVNNADFLRLALNAQRAAAGEPELTAEQFAPLLRERMRQVHIDEVFAERDLNSGFSGGQKKRNEILQMFVLQPRLAVLDETDSGLDIDALRIVAEGINAYRSPAHAIVLITHYQRLLDLVRPDRVHILADGRIARSGGFELAAALEAGGYAGVMG